jgi:hypothetical protein
MNGVNTPASRPLPMRIALCLLGTLFLSVAPALPQSTLENGLQIYYPFAQAEDGALDASGNGRHGTLIGTSWCNEGHLAGSRHLGEGSYINAGNEVNFASWPQYSISLWFRHDLSPSDATGYGDKLLCKSTIHSDVYIRMLPSRSGYEYGPGYITFIASIPSGTYAMECREDFRDNTWHHLAIVRDGKFAEMWVDGVLRRGSETAFSIPDNAQPIYLGYSPSPDPSQRRYWPGDIDEFRIYNRALSAKEVRTLAGVSTSDLDDKATRNRQTYEHETLTILEANIADADPQWISDLMERLIKAGARDAWAVPIITRNARTALTLRVLSGPRDIASLRRMIFQATGTAGVREREVNHATPSHHQEETAQPPPQAPIPVKVDEI